MIDMREISSAFGQPLDQIELDLAALITSGSIKAKIDSHKKLLISRKENIQLDSYKQAVLLGATFIKETEDQLFKIALLNQNIVLEEKNHLNI